MQRRIDAAFLQNKGFVVRINFYDMKDSDFQYILHKDTQRIQILNLQQINLFIHQKNAISQMGLHLEFKFNNNIGNMGCKYLSRVSFPQLQNIQLSKNQISSIGVGHLQKHLWKKLKHINLCLNNIGIDCVDKLSQIFKNKKKKYMRSIDIMFNRLLIDQIYKFILYDSKVKKDVQIYAYRNKIEPCYIDKCKSIMKQKNKIKLDL